MIATRAVILVAVVTALASPGFLIFLDRPVYAQSSSSPPVTISTDNKSVSVVVSWTPKDIQAGQDVAFSLTFKDPSSGQTLSHVNYGLKIVDSGGTTIKSIDGLHTHSGQDTQTVKLGNKGDFTLQINVIGLGLNQPFDTSKSGTAQASITVVPEFPFALVAMTVGVAIVLALAWSRYSVFRFDQRRI